MVQWDTEDDKCDFFYAKRDDLSREMEGVDMTWIGFVMAGMTWKGFCGKI